MENSSRIYARNIFLAHLALFCVVLAVVAIAAREIYSSARDQAIQQASVRQELLASQTARGISSYYTSIISDLELFRRAEPFNTTRPSSSGQTTQPSSRVAGNGGGIAAGRDEPPGREPPPGAGFAQGRPLNPQNAPNGRGTGRGGPVASTAGRANGRGGRGGRNFQANLDNDVVTLLWSQLGERASAVFYYDLTVGDPGARVTLRAGGQPSASVDVEALGEDIERLASGANDWLMHVQKSAVSRIMPIRSDSPLQRQGASTGVNLVAVRDESRPTRLIVAVVPAVEVQTRFLPLPGDRRNTSATLLDENLSVIATTSPQFTGIGRSLKEIDDVDTRRMVMDYTTNPRTTTIPFNETVPIAGEILPPRLMTIEPVIVPQTNWSLLITSPMSSVDDVVQGVFRTVIYWAAFLVVSMTAILVSTAFQMVRVRLRMERIEHEALEREISQARQIQLNWLPDPDKRNPALDIAAINRPANHISGDFYNWFNLPDGRQVVMIGDVTGHGMSAAFLMATTQMLVRTTMPRLPDPGACLTEINRQLCTQVFHGQFVTMLILVLDLGRGKIELATAGHSAPLVSDHGGEFVPLPVMSQLVLAVDADQAYPTEQYALPSLGTLILYTDGLLDVQAEKGERFEINRLLQCLNGPFNCAQAIIDDVIAKVNKFRGNREPDDDLTLLAIQCNLARLGNPSAPGTNPCPAIAADSLADQTSHPVDTITPAG